MLTIVSVQRKEGRAMPLKINRHHTKIGIKNQLATTKVDQIFVNPNGFEINGMYLLKKTPCQTMQSFQTLRCPLMESR